jgi:hypothetical protein
MVPSQWLGVALILAGVFIIATRMTPEAVQ